MPFRRRDTRKSYSSADAYRSLRNPANVFESHQDSSPSAPHHERTSSNEDDSMPPSALFPPDHTHVTERTALNPVTPTRSRMPTSTGDSDMEDTPLSPPRPFFLGNPRSDSGDRGSWSSTATLEPVSDNDIGSTESVPRLQTVGAARRPTVRTTTTAAATKRSNNGQPVIVGGGSKAARAAMRYSNSNRDGASSPSSQMSTSPTGGKPPVPPPPPASLRARIEHRRRSSTVEDNASAVNTTSSSHQSAENPDALSTETDPFQTPTSSVYAPSGVNITPLVEPSAPVEAQEPSEPTEPTVVETATTPDIAPGSEVAPVVATTMPAPVSPPFPTPTQRPTILPRKIAAPKPITHSPVAGAVKPPPSAFPSFPFQSHPGNPDPGTHIPGVPRRSSLDSFRNLPSRPSSAQSNAQLQHAGNVYGTGYTAVPHSEDQMELERPNAAFMHEDEMGQMREGSATPPTPSSIPGIYKNSAAAAMGSTSQLVGGDVKTSIPRNTSVPSIVMRAPFLSPASRPTSTVWSPPSYPAFPYPGSPNQNSAVYPPDSNHPSSPYLPANGGSNPYLARKTKAPLPSSRLVQKLTDDEKPWLNEKDGRGRASWWLTFACFILGVGGSAVICYLGWTNVKFLKDSDLCLVMEDEFNEGSLNTDFWTPDVELGGFGNGEFQMTTTNDKNLFIQNGQLYLAPTLTSDEIGKDSIFRGYTYRLGDKCTASSNSSTCSVTSGSGTVVNPVQSARISTKGKKSIKFGKVEVKAKNPRGDWLWPAIWMLPSSDSVYGQWPLGGEIDIMEARGNGPEYTAQGLNYVRSSLNYGPFQSLQTHLFGWWSNKRATFDSSFHTYSLEWTPDWMRFYVDERLQATMNVKVNGKGGHSFFELGKYPSTTKNGSDVDVVVKNIWDQAGGSRAAPFDQDFYLIIDLAAGGTSGWFPDGVGDKPWIDGSSSAMFDFAYAQDTWSATWPSDMNDRAFRIESVKMWSLGRCSS